MLKVSDLQNYTNQIKEELPEINSAYLAVTKENLTKFMQSHTKQMNILMVSLVPEHDMGGSADSAKWENTVGFYFLEKTDYSQHDHEGYIAIFTRTQLVAEKFVKKLIEDKADNKGLFCGFLAWLDENAITVSPVAALNQCNGWYVQIMMKSNV